MMAILLKHREAPIPSLRAFRSEVPAPVDQVFQRMVAKKPEERFASMAEVVRALETIAFQPLFPPKPSGPPIGQTARPTPTVDIAPAAPTNQTVDLAAGGDTGLGSKTILLVEPSRSQAVIIRGYLQKLGYQNVPTAPTGQKALELARAAPPGVVISAMHLADMTGMQLVQKMTGEVLLCSTRFVLITSQAEAQEAHFQGQSQNVVRLHKPFDLDQLSRGPGRGWEDSLPGQAARPQGLDRGRQCRGPHPHPHRPHGVGAESARPRLPTVPRPWDCWKRRPMTWW